MKRLSMLILGIVTIGLSLLVSSGTGISSDDTVGSRNVVTSNTDRRANSSPGATIAITMYSGDGE